MMLQKYRKQIEGATMVMAIIIPIMTLPQLFKIWLEQNAQGVSLSTWCVYLVSTIIWLLYGLLNKDLKLIVLNISLLCINSGIVVGILLFG